MPTLIIHSPQLSDAQTRVLTQQLGCRPHSCGSHFRAEPEQPVSRELLDPLREQLSLDINVLPEAFVAGDVRLLLTDMDSTLINIECVDEIADFIGVKPQVAAITESAMRGEIDFAASLRQRVGLLAGLDVAALSQVYEQRLQLNPGAEVPMAGLRERRIKRALVSGGFTFFTSRLKQRLALDFTLANELAIDGGQLTGEVQGDIIGAEAKARFLTQLCAELDIEPRQVIAIGDGANDLPMLELAGLGVAYYAKPAVGARADVLIRYRGLDAVLDFLPL